MVYTPPSLPPSLPAAYSKAVLPLPVIKASRGLHLRALVDIADDGRGVRRRTGDEWQLRGPLTYIPSPEVVSVGL